MRIKEVHKSYNGDFIEKSVIHYNQNGLKSKEEFSGTSKNYFYDEANRLIRVERNEYTDDPNEWEIRYKDSYEYKGSNFRVITYKVQSRAINDDWYPRDEIAKVREVQFHGKNKILDKTTYFRTYNTIEYTKYRYRNDELIYEKRYELDGTTTKKEYLNNNLLSEEQKVIAHWEENSPELFLKTTYKYNGDQLIEEHHYINDTHKFTIKNSYLNNHLIKKSKYNIIEASKIICNYTNYFYLENGDLVRKEVYEHYKDKDILCEYEVIEYEENTETIKHFSNEEYYDLNNSSNIDYSKSDKREFWIKEFQLFGTHIENDSVDEYMKSIDKMFENWNFDLTWEKTLLKNDKGDLIKEVYTKPIGANENAYTLINHYEYNDNGEQEFVLKLNSLGTVSSISKYYYF